MFGGHRPLNHPVRGGLRPDAYGFNTPNQPVSLVSVSEFVKFPIHREF